MKRLVGFAIFFFILYIIYYDISIGTLPVAKGEPTITENVAEEVEASSEPVEQEIPFQSVEIKAGDTLLSVVEELSQKRTDLSISTIIEDFEEMNPGVKANSLQIGKIYKIPVYQ
ncbi:hypothetical protein [Bacillus sp. PS06]|uniref:hypothetical protein n=1 Tax=Bacillus sp. PS06 TaxID=2764176 RepID=UPI0017876645|nr:hypothetical protein [Bacillus sp. PS06]MBD8069161.1 hypothetical protein [Bacillus sp. PS06]